MIKTAFSFIALLFSISTQAQKSAAPYDKLMSELFKPNGPGGAAIVVKDGNIVYRKAMGKANMELDVNMTPENVFRIGSITKQFTACAIMKLSEEGKLSVDDDITKYLKDFPTHGHKITIEHLLTHTSGIKSMTGMKEWDAETRKRDFTPAGLLDFFKNQPMDFAPGEDFRYNNSGYLMLGNIIEIVSGKSYATYIEENFFKPLGMNNSYYDSPTKVIKNRADGYEAADVNTAYLSMSQPYAAGSLMSTVDDLSKWYTAVMQFKVVSDASLKRAHKSFVLNDGRETGYGYGWSLLDIKESKGISHGGGINGFLTYSLYLSKEKLFVAVLSNCNCNPPEETSYKMAAIALGKPYLWNAIAMSEDELKSYVAIYTSKYQGDRTITFKDGKLYFQRTGGAKYEIVPFAMDNFFFPEDVISLQFKRNSKNEIVSVDSQSPGQDSQWERSDRPIPTYVAIDVDESLLNNYKGTYQLSPDFLLKVFSENDKMFVQATGQAKVQIIAIEAHQFKLVDVDAKITFNIKDGVTSNLTLHQNGDHLAKKIE